MKKIFLFVFISALWFVTGYSQQYPVSQYLGATNTLVITRGALKVDSAFILPAFGDTAYANISPYIKNYPGTLIRVLDVIYMRNYNATQWIAIQGGGGGGNPWNITGNSNATAGSSFLGTTNNIPLEFRVINKKSGYLDSTYKTTSFGYGSLRDLTPSGTTTGNHNVSIGYKSMNKDTTGYQNTSLGSQSLLNSSGSTGNVSLGYGTMGLSRSVDYNVAVGWGALSKNYYGDFNTAIGHNSAGNLVPSVGDTLIYNTFLGAFSGYNQRSGRNNVMIGDSAGLSNQSGSRNVFIGSKAGSNETGSDKLYIANTSTTTPLIKGDFSTKKLNIGDYLLIGSSTQPADSTLDVKGGVRLQSLYSSNNDSDSMLVVKSNGGVGIRTTPANYWTKIADTIYNNNVGYVGIGTSSPDFKLDVNGIIGTNNGVNIATNGAKTGFYSNGNRMDIWAGNNKIADIGLAGANQNLYNLNYSIQPATGATGNQNSLNLSSSVTAGGLGTNSVNVAQLNIAPSYNQAPISGALGTGTLRGIYYNPTVASLNTSPHYAIETTSGELKFANISTSSDTTYKPMAMNSSGDVVKMNNWITGGGGGGSGTVTSVATGYGLSGGTITTSGTLLVDTATLSTKYVRVSDYDTIYTTSPIMTMQSGDSTIIYFNSDTANAWRNSSGGFVPYTGATQDVDLGTNKISSQSVYITGTNGNGHLHLKHQANDATATGQSTSLFADSNGDIKWKNDGDYYTTLKTSDNTANAIYTYPSATTTLIGASDTAAMLANYVRTNAISSGYLSSDATTTNLTATNTNLTFPIAANETWRIMVAGTAKNSTTGQVKIAIAAPTGCTMRGIVNGGGATMGSSTVNQALNAVNTLSAGFATGNNVEVAFRFEGVVVNGANAGSITLQFAAGTTGTATIYNGTLMQWTRTKPL